MDYSEECNISTAVTSCSDTGSNDGLSVIISVSLQTAIGKKPWDYLCYKRRQVVLVQILTPEEEDPVYSGRLNLIDSESGDVSDNRNMKLRITRGMQAAYEEAMRDLKEDIRSYCTSRAPTFSQ